MKTLEVRIPDIDGKPSPDIYITGILKQGYECSGAACTRDTVPNFKLNGHTIGHIWKYLEQDLQISPMTEFSKAETFEQFSERVTGYMCSIEGDLPPDTWHTEFKELLYEAVKSSTPQNIVQPNIKGVTPVNKYLTKKEYWKLFVSEKRGIDAREEERKRKEKEKKEKEEKERREKKEREEREEKARKEKEAEEKRRKEEKEKEERRLKDINDHAAKYGLEYKNGYFTRTSSKEIEKIPLFRRTTIMDRIERTLMNMYTKTSYNVNKEFDTLVRNKEELATLLSKETLWNAGASDANNYRFDPDLDDDDNYGSFARKLRKESMNIINKNTKYNTAVEDAGDTNIFDELLHEYGKASILIQAGETNLDGLYNNLFATDPCKKYIDINNPIEGFKQFIKEFDFSSWEDGKDFYSEDAMDLFMNNLNEIKENLNLGVGFMNLNISEDTKDTLRQGARRGTIKAATRKAADHIAEAVAGQTSGKSKRELAAYKQHVAEFLKTEWGQAAVSAVAGQALPLIAEKLGKGPAVQSLAKELNIQGVEIVTEQVAGAAFDLAGMGITHLIDTFKNVVEQDEVNVTPVASLGAGSGQRIETTQKVAETVG